LFVTVFAGPFVHFDTKIRLTAILAGEKIITSHAI